MQEELTEVAAGACRSLEVADGGVMREECRGWEIPRLVVVILLPPVKEDLDAKGLTQDTSHCGIAGM
jgi:hypothetical protein